MARTFVQRIHNPKGRTCYCDPDCWCQRTALGRTVKWWFPARRFGIHHKQNVAIPNLSADELHEWKRQQDQPDG